MNTLDHALQTRRIGRSLAAFADIGAGEIQRGGHLRPRLRFAVAMARHGPDSRRWLAREVLQIHPQHLEESRPAGLETFQFVVPIILRREQTVHHADDIGRPSDW